MNWRGPPTSPDTLASRTATYRTLKVLQRNGKHRPWYSGDDAGRRFPQVSWGIVRPVAPALAPTDPGPDPGGEGQVTVG